MTDSTDRGPTSSCRLILAGLGRPLLYGTTPLFLELLGLRDLADLPRTEELSIALHPHRPQGEDSAEEAAASVVAES